MQGHTFEFCDIDLWGGVVYFRDRKEALHETSPAPVESSLTQEKIEEHHMYVVRVLCAFGSEGWQTANVFRDNFTMITRVLMKRQTA